MSMLVRDARSRRVSRAIARTPRLLLATACIVLMLAGGRSILAATPPSVAAHAPAPISRDVAAESLAESFTRTYLEWDGEVAAENLRDFGADVEPPSVPPGINQRVKWTSVSDVAHTPTAVVVTVAAATTAGMYHLAVPIGRGRRGMRFIAREPAIVGAIPVTRPSRLHRSREVHDDALIAVVRRTLRNYLGRDQSDLSADLDNTAVVVLPHQDATLEAIDQLDWVVPGRGVAATVRARFTGGVELTLIYELTVARRAGRWLTRAINNHVPEVHR